MSDSVGSSDLESVREELIGAIDQFFSSMTSVVAESEVNRLEAEKYKRRFARLQAVMSGDDEEEGNGLSGVGGSGDAAIIGEELGVSGESDSQDERLDRTFPLNKSRVDVSLQANPLSTGEGRSDGSEGRQTL